MDLMWMVLAGLVTLLAILVTLGIKLLRNRARKREEAWRDMEARRTMVFPTYDRYTRAPRSVPRTVLPIPPRHDDDDVLIPFVVGAVLGSMPSSPSPPSEPEPFQGGGGTFSGAGADGGWTSSSGSSSSDSSSSDSSSSDSSSSDSGSSA